jgi:hypothetical protein
MISKYLFKSYIDRPQTDLYLENNEKISVLFVDSNQVKFEAASKQIAYFDIWKNVDIVYDFEEKEIKETIILKNEECQDSFCFDISGYSNYTYVEDSFHFFGASGQYLYGIDRPFLILSNGEKNFESVRHKIDGQRYIIKINKSLFKKEDYPILIDPTMSFYPNMADSYVDGEIVGGAKKAQVFITGSNQFYEKLAYSNTLQGQPKTLLGSDKVTFHKNVNTYIDFIDTSATLQDIYSIKISSKEKVTTIYDEDSGRIQVSMSLSPAMKYVINGQIQYEFMLTFSNSISQASELKSPIAKLVINKDGLLPSEDVGIIIQQPTLEENSQTKYKIIYSSPQNLPENETEIILEVKVEFSFISGAKTTTVIEKLYSYIEIVSAISKVPFSFRENASKTDFINGDFYAPTTNRGLVIIDSSMGIVKNLEYNGGLLTEDELNVICAGRIGTYNDPYGVLVCTEGGAFIYNSDPYEEPVSFKSNMKKKISSKKIIDFAMSGNNLFLLEDIGTVYRIDYRHIMAIVGDGSDYSSTIDGLFATKFNQPFRGNNFYAGYLTPYTPDPDGLPQKILTIDINADYPIYDIESVYFDGSNKKWEGISLMYRDSSTGRKVVLTIAYAPSSSDNDTDEEDKEECFNRAVFISEVDTESNGPYIINKITSDDHPKVVFDWEPDKDKLPEASTYNYPLLYAPPTKYASSRVIVGGVSIDTQKTNTSFTNFMPVSGKYYFCPRNLTILSISEVGPYFDPVTGEEVIL